MRQPYLGPLWSPSFLFSLAPALQSRFRSNLSLALSRFISALRYMVRSPPSRSIAQHVWKFEMYVYPRFRSFIWPHVRRQTYRIAGNFREAEIFARFSRSNTSSRKFVLAKICSSTNFLLITSRAQCLRAVDPVNQQKIDLFCHRSIEQLWKIFATYDQLAANANRSSELAPSLWHGSFSPTATDTLW